MAGEMIVEAEVVYAASALINTAVDVAVPGDSDTNVEPGEAKYEVLLRNPSANSGVTVHVKSFEPHDATWGGGADHYPELTSFDVPINTPEGKSQEVVGWDLSRGGRVTCTLDAALGVGQGFTAELRVRRL